MEIAYAPARVRKRHSLRNQLDLNDAVNSVLRTVYDTSALEGTIGRRPVVFTSFAPDVCAALNWKQPNCTSPPLPLARLHVCPSSNGNYVYEKGRRAD